MEIVAGAASTFLGAALRVSRLGPRSLRSPRPRKPSRDLNSGFLGAICPFKPLPNISPRLIQTLTPILP
jgi:hypothetical protein